MVSQIPGSGFYGLLTGDVITAVNDIAVHTTQGFIDDLGASRNGVASVQALRNEHLLTLPIPKKGHSLIPLKIATKA